MSHSFLTPDILKKRVRATNILLIHRIYPILFPVVMLYFVYPLLIWNMYQVYQHYDYLYLDIIKFAQYLFPVVGLFCPLVLMHDYRREGVCELIRIHIKSLLFEMSITILYHCLLSAGVLLLFSIGLPDVRTMLASILLPLALYIILYYFFTAFFQNTILPFFLVLLYHAFNIHIMESSPRVFGCICFLSYYPLNAKRIVFCILWCTAFGIAGICSERRQKHRA